MTERPGAAESTVAGVDAERIHGLVVAFIRDELGEVDAEQFDPDENIFTGGLVDSVGIVRLIGHLEETLRVTVPRADLVPDNFRTVRVMATYLSRLCRG